MTNTHIQYRVEWTTGNDADGLEHVEVYDNKQKAMAKARRESAKTWYGTAWIVEEINGQQVQAWHYAYGHIDGHETA